MLPTLGADVPPQPTIPRKQFSIADLVSNDDDPVQDVIPTDSVVAADKTTQIHLSPTASSLLLHPSDNKSTTNSESNLNFEPGEELEGPAPLPAQSCHDHETFFGFIKEPLDALLVVEACIRGKLISVDKVPSDTVQVWPIRSGSIVVFEESSKRWRDGRRWSPSRVFGPFLLYREVEATKRAPEPRKRKPKHILDTRIPGLEPTYSEKTLKPNTRLVEDGLTKRTITLRGSDGLLHRVISYYAREDVIHMYVPDEAILASADNTNPKFATPSDAPKLKELLDDTSVDWKALLAESIDMGKYASEIAVAKKQRKEDSIKAVARHAFVKDEESDGSETDSMAKRQKTNHDATSPVRVEINPSNGLESALGTRLPSVAALTAYAESHHYHTMMAHQQQSPSYPHHQQLRYLGNFSLQAKRQPSLPNSETPTQQAPTKQFYYPPRPPTESIWRQQSSSHNLHDGSRQHTFSNTRQADHCPPYQSSPQHLFNSQHNYQPLSLYQQGLPSLPYPRVPPRPSAPYYRPQSWNFPSNNQRSNPTVNPLPDTQYPPPLPYYPHDGIDK
ncbi:UNVERIFIED_CONTAM: hypothetical protein HDU68_006075 [Siphonaria sp. JEL0065]|nr:hypothetical protein HDU68_006075 [Siphonaria sp. JEL0065]